MMWYKFPLVPMQNLTVLHTVDYLLEYRLEDINLTPTVEKPQKNVYTIIGNRAQRGYDGLLPERSDCTNA